MKFDTNAEALTLYRTLQNLPPDWVHPQLLYGLHRNREKMKTFTRPLEEIQSKVLNFARQDAGFRAFNEEREAILKDFCKKDGDGNCIMKTIEENGQTLQVYDIDLEDKKFKTKMKKLQDSHKVDFDRLEEENSRLNELMAAACDEDFTPYYIKLEWLSEVKCPDSIFKVIFPLIKPEDD